MVRVVPRDSFHDFFSLCSACRECRTHSLVIVELECLAFRSRRVAPFLAVEKADAVPVPSSFHCLGHRRGLVRPQPCPDVCEPVFEDILVTVWGIGTETIQSDWIGRLTHCHDVTHHGLQPPATCMCTHVHTLTNGTA